MNTHIQWLFREINVCCLFLPPPSKNHKHLPKSPALKSVNTLHCLSSPEIVFVNEQKNCLSVILCLHMTASSKTEHKERSSADIVHIYEMSFKNILVQMCHHVISVYMNLLVLDLTLNLLQKCKSIVPILCVKVQDVFAIALFVILTKRHLKK